MKSAISPAIYSQPEKFKYRRNVLSHKSVESCEKFRVQRSVTSSSHLHLLWPQRCLAVSLLVCTCSLSTVPGVLQGWPTDLQAWPTDQEHRLPPGTCWKTNPEAAPDLPIPEPGGNGVSTRLTIVHMCADVCKPARDPHWATRANTDSKTVGICSLWWVSFLTLHLEFWGGKVTNHAGNTLGYGGGGETGH